MKQKSHQSAYATKIKKLLETAKQLRTENFRLALPITRLTSIKSLCQDEVAAQQFALYMSKRVQQQINDADCASHLNPEEWEQNKTLIANAITQMERYLETPTPDGKQSLCHLLRQIDELQGDDYRNVSWTTVRFVKSGELLKLEYAIRCFVEHLEPIRNQYDFILIDCPPSLGVLSILALTAGTHVLIPIQTHFKAFKGTELLLDTIKQVRKHVNPKLAIAGIVPTLYSNANQDKLILEALEQQLSSLAKVYPAIPRATAFADAAMSRQPLAVYAPKHPAITVLKKIAQGMEKL